MTATPTAEAPPQSPTDHTPHDVACTNLRQIFEADARVTNAAASMKRQKSAADAARANHTDAVNARPPDSRP